MTEYKAGKAPQQDSQPISPVRFAAGVLGWLLLIDLMLHASWQYSTVLLWLWSPLDAAVLGFFVLAGFLIAFGHGGRWQLAPYGAAALVMVGSFGIEFLGPFAGLLLLLPLGAGLMTGRFLRGIWPRLPGRPVLRALAVALVVLSAGAVVSPWGLPGETATFEDERIEAVARSALPLVFGRMTTWQVAQISELDASGLGIERLGGIEQFGGFVSLNLRDNAISDISPLAGISAFNLDLSGNSITDITPLTGYHTYRLDLSRNSITDISPLASLEGLGILNLSENDVTDLSPLLDLQLLHWLDLNGNAVADITPLAVRLKQSLENVEFYDDGGLSMSGDVGLECLYLANNNIADLSPLLEPSFLDASLLGYLDLRGNGLDLSPDSLTYQQVAALPVWYRWDVEPQERVALSLHTIWDRQVRLGDCF